MPVFHLLAGPNGAGKSTLHQTLIAPRFPSLPFAITEAERLTALDGAESFATESAFSHPSKLDLMTQASSRGFEVVLYLVCVDEPKTLLERVKHCAHQGAPALSLQETMTRYSRALALLREALPLADLSLLFDGCHARAGGPRLIASVAKGRMYLHTPLRPRWVDQVMGFAEG